MSRDILILQFVKSRQLNHSTLTRIDHADADCGRLLNSRIS
jgi:hypothetical protein